MTEIQNTKMCFSTVILLLLIVLDIVVYYLQKQREKDDYKQRKSSPASSTDQRSLHQGGHGERKDSSSSWSQDKQCRRFSLAEIELGTNDFSDALVIGKGGFGKVYKGTMAGIDVAIKRLNHDSLRGSEFWSEVKTLSMIRHSHIVSLLGYHQQSDEKSGEKEMILVYEYMPNGSLEDHLHKRRADGSNSSPLTWEQRLRICIGAARGLDYLHTGTGVQHRVIHGDVKSSNILLDENWAAKISDFGLSTYESGPTNVSTDHLQGTFGYMDPESLLTHRFTRKSDVYSFGVVLLEILCGRGAQEINLDEQKPELAVWAKRGIKEGRIGRIIDPVLRGQASANWLKEFGQLAYKCVQERSKDRPTMNVVLVRLEAVFALTLSSRLSASNWKHNARNIFIEKPWDVFLTKAPTVLTSSDTKKHGQSSGNKKKGIMMENGDTTVAEGRCHSGDVNTASQELVAPGGQKVTPTLMMFMLSEIQSATRNFDENLVIGEGGFGKVYKGWVDNVTYEPQKFGSGIPVAVKRFDPNRGQGVKEWQVEVELLGKFSHPNIVKLLGYCSENEELLLVYEYVQKGSLYDHLFRKGAEPLSWVARLKIAMGAAQGLAFLHSTENVIVRDVKSSNILLDGSWNAKLSDFGLAWLGPVNRESYVSADAAGTFGYMAPEYSSIGQLCMKSDVYGFGVTMLEMITGSQAWDNCQHCSWQRNLVNWARPFLSNIHTLRRIMDPRLEQDFPSRGAKKAANLILSCVDLVPWNRPSMEEVLANLKEIRAIQMKPRLSKAKSRHSMSLHNEQWSNIHRCNDEGSPLCTRSWSDVWFKQNQIRMETNRAKTEKWGY